MRMFWQQVVKDVRLLKWPLAAWLVLVGAVHGLVLIVGSQTWPGGSLLRFGNQAETLLVSLATCVFVVATALLVQQDAPARPDGFWLTRPIASATMFGAKLATSVVLLALVPLAADAFDHWWFGVRPVFLSAPSPATGFAWLFLLMAVAAATTSLAQFVLIAIFEIVLFGGLISVADSLKVLGLLDFRAFLGMVAGFAFIVSGSAYLMRRQRVTATLLGCTPVILTALAIIIWPASRDSLRAAQVQVQPCRGAVTAQIDTDAVYRVDRPGSFDIAAPVRFTGLRPGWTAMVLNGSGNWFETGGERIALGRSKPSADETADGVRKELEPSLGKGVVMHNLRAAPVTRRDVVVARGVPRLANQNGVLHLEANVAVFRYEPQGTLRLAAGASSRTADGVRQILGVSASAQRITVRLREAQSASSGPSMFYPSRSVWALRSGGFNQAILADSGDEARFGFVRTGMLTVILPIPQNLTFHWQTLTFDVPPREVEAGHDGGRWLAQSELLLVGLHQVTFCQLAEDLPDVNLGQLPRRSTLSQPGRR